MDHSQKDHSQMDQSQMDHSQMDHNQRDHSQMDHSQMDHSQKDHSQMDHSQMDHSQMDHSQKDQSQMDHSQKDHSQMDHSQMDHSQMDHKLVSPPSVSIVEKGRNLTLVGKRLSWSDALLYCRDFHWDLLSLRGPEDQETMDELVAGAPFPLTGHLWVGLRRSILGTSWYWMSGDPMDFTRWEQASHQSSPCGGVSSKVPSTWGQRSCEDHRHFMCSTGPTEGVNKVHFYSSTRETQTSC
ncbi:hypothetical protein NHX12_015292 [Muraenolepis orangiensis]|uniref:C-type lectin domain-containing protein n=1 Tax=Muraenolepis orangiensis TaxID=630683 RepID=A0A9Q0DAK7_9TELE|nr:hypothetical protein NHX12_015292 [Muraenolepis orangiensis]